MTAKRGNLLTYDSATGKGLVSVEGEKIPFDVTAWKSDKVPSVGMGVEVTTADDGTHSFTPANSADDVKEQLSKFGERLGKEGPVVAKEFASFVGTPVLVGYGVFLVATILLDFVTIRFFGMGGGGASLFGFASEYSGLLVILLLVSYLSVATTYFWKNQLAWLAYGLPALVIVFVLIRLMGVYSDATEGLGGFMGSDGPSLFEFVRPGPGFYLSVIAAGYLAYVGIQNFRKKKPL